MGALNPEFMREFRAAKPSVPAVLAWIEALRSGRFDSGQHCCLAVATETAIGNTSDGIRVEYLGFENPPSEPYQLWDAFSQANDTDNWTFDQIADWLETAINLQRTIDLLSALPDERFNISSLRTNSVSDEELQHNCGTAACIAGWASLFHLAPIRVYYRAQYALGLDRQQAEYLFLPIGWDRQAWTREDAIATLIRFRDTGEISWA
jgi:hypothetical protein